MISSDRPEQHRAKSRCVSKPVPSTAEGEHNLDVIKTADWVLDLGPGGGVNGGEIVAEGTPEKVAAEPKSFTGQYLAPLLSRSAHPEERLSSGEAAVEGAARRTPKRKRQREPAE